MGVPYNILMRNVAVRINALTNATNPTELEAAYTIDPLTAPDVLGSAVFNFSAIRDAVLLSEQKLAQTIAETKDHAWRAKLISQTGTEPLASGATLPPQDEDGLSIIGLYGSVYDSADNRELYEQPAQVIQRRLATPALWKIPVYHYAIVGDSIVHTRTLVRVEVCVWDYLNQQAAIEANDDMLLPDVLEEAVICGAISMLVRDDEWLAQGSQYVAYYNETLAAIRGGETKVKARAA